jgi:hypothetical protein
MAHLVRRLRAAIEAGAYVKTAENLLEAGPFAP